MAPGAGGVSGPIRMSDVRGSAAHVAGGAVTAWCEWGVHPTMNNDLGGQIRMTANIPTLVTFAIYLIGMLLIGWMGYRATTNLSDTSWAGAAWAVW